MLIPAIICTTAMLLMPSQSITGAKQGIDLCLNAVIPSLFPFFVCSRLLISCGIPQLIGKKFGRAFELIFGINRGCSFAFIAGLLCGYPVGAKIVGDMYKEGQCTKNEAQRMLAFCNNSGPLFIIGTVGTGMLRSPKDGLVLYLAHIMSAAATGIAVRFMIPSKGKISPVAIHTASLKGSFHNAITDSVVSMTGVCGNIVFFSVIISALQPILNALITSSMIRGLISGIIEISTGINNLAPLSPLPIIGFLLAWSGISVIMQVDGIISPTGLSTPLFAATKLLQGILGGFFAYLISKLTLPDALSYTANATAVVIICAAILTAFLVLTEIWKKTLHR